LNIKKNIIYVLCFIAFIILVLNTGICLAAAKEGLSLWINVVFPSLFPFFIATSILISCGAASAFGEMLSPVMNKLFKASGESGYIIATSMLSGYPMGPRLCAQMYSKGYIDTDQVEHFLSFVNTSGPSFIIGAVAGGMLRSTQLGTYIALSHYLGAMLTGMLFSIKRNKIKAKHYIPQQLEIPPFGKMLSEAVNNAMQTQLVIGGYIILFSIIINLLLQLNILQSISGIFALIGINDSELITSTLAGLFEITNSCSLLVKNVKSLNTLLPILSAVISFSGFSILMQSYTLISETGVQFKALIFPKIVHAVIAFLLCNIALMIFPISLETSNIVINYSYSFVDIIINSLSYSIIYVLAIFITIIMNRIILNNKKPD